MTVDSTRQRAINELKEALAEKRAGVFIGAGISVASGLPTWQGLLEELIEKLDGQPATNKETISDCKKLLLDPNKSLVLAEVLREELGKSFTDYIEDRFTDKKIKPNLIHNAVVGVDWRAIVTTNYDRLIERAFAKKFGDDGDIPVLLYDNAARIASNYRRNRKFILKAHGDARERPEKVILTEKDYRRIIHCEIGYQSILQSLFTTTSFLFLGCSLADPDLKLLLSFLHSAFHGDTPTSYALIPSNERLSVEDKRFYHDFSIHIVPIDPSKREDEILGFIKDLTS